MLKSRLMNIINCHDDDMINKYIQVINSAVKECRNLLLLMHYKMIRNFLLNWVAQLLKHLIIIVILIFNNVALTNVVVDMLWTAKITERIQFIINIMIIMQHQDDVSVSKQESKEIVKNIML